MARSYGSVLALVGLASVVLAGGFFIGSSLLRRDADGVVPLGSVVEVHLADGTVYVGELRAETEHYLALDSPAIVLVDTAAEDATTYRVQALADDPYSIDGPIRIARDRISVIGAIRQGSPLDHAYRDVMTRVPRESPAAS